MITQTIWTVWGPLKLLRPLKKAQILDSWSWYQSMPKKIRHWARLVWKKCPASNLPAVHTVVARCLVEDWIWTKVSICVITDRTFAELGNFFLAIIPWPCKLLAQAFYVPFGNCSVVQVFHQVVKHVFQSLVVLFSIFEQHFNRLW